MSGATSCSTACWRFSRSPLASAWTACSWAASHLRQLRHARLQRLGAERLERGRQPLLGVVDGRQTLLRLGRARARGRPGSHQLALELAGADSLTLELAPRPHQLALELASPGRAGRERTQPGPQRQQRGACAASSPIISQIAFIASEDGVVTGRKGMVANRADGRRPPQPASACSNASRAASPRTANTTRWRSLPAARCLRTSSTSIRAACATGKPPTPVPNATSASDARPS